MSETSTLWRPPLGDALKIGRHGRRVDRAGVTVDIVRPARAWSLVARRGAADALAIAAEQELGLPWPKAPRYAARGSTFVVWTGPDRWLLVEGPAGMSDSVRATLPAGVTSHVYATDQTDALQILHLSGPRLRDALAKGVTIDLHPRSFAPGNAAITQVSHLTVNLWQISDDPIFGVAVARSLAGSFASWLTASAAEFGLEVRDGADI